MQAGYEGDGEGLSVQGPRQLESGEGVASEWGWRGLWRGANQ